MKSLAMAKNSVFQTIAIVSVAQGASLVLWWIAGSYFGIDVYASRILPGDDGWCLPEKDGLGVHCWGDYYYPVFLLGLENPWGFEIINPYPSASLLLFSPFKFVGELFGAESVGLVLYLLSLTTAMTISVWSATKGQYLSVRVALLSMLTLLSPPFLVVFDRGNSTGFLLPAILYFFSALNSGSTKKVIVSLVLMSIIKPHFIAVAIILAIRGKWKSFLIALGSAGIVHVIAFFVIRPEQFTATILGWIANLSSYQTYSTVEIPWPVNISFAQALYSLFYGIQQIPGVNVDNTMQYLAREQGLVGPFVAVSLAAVLIASRKLLNNFQISALLISAISLVSATTYAYYALVAIPFLLMLIRDRTFRVPSSLKELSFGNTKSKVDLAIWATSLVSLVQWPIFGFDLNGKVLTTYSLFGAWWFICYVVVLILALSAKSVNGLNSGRKGENT